MLETGTVIPPLVGIGADGKRISLSDYGGQWIVVYFYPKDNTTGCTREAQDFRDLYDEFRRFDAAVIGVSRDSPRSHASFAGKHDLPFPLVSDADETWCKAFDVIAEKVLYGRRYLGVVRSTFLIAPDGRLAAQWRNVRVAGHAAEVLRSIPSA
jgi:peroxiredoxin Q/BCP